MSEKRNFKIRVTCNGKPFRTVYAAFVEHNLPINKHGRFRLKLYDKGSDIFEHKGETYRFVHVKQDAIQVQEVRSPQNIAHEARALHLAAEVQVLWSKKLAHRQIQNEE